MPYNQIGIKDMTLQCLSKLISELYFLEMARKYHLRWTMTVTIYWRALKYQTNLNFEISFDRNKFFMNNALSKEDLNNKPIRPEVLKCPTDSYLSKIGRFLCNIFKVCDPLGIRMSSPMERCHNEPLCSNWQ